MIRLTTLAAGLALLSACGGPASMSLRGVKPLNENDRKESTPVDIRLYQLKDDARFKQATVDQLWTKDKEALGEDLVSVKTVTVHPGAIEDKAARIELGELPAGVRFLGVLALFPKEDDKGPRKLVVPSAEAGSRTLRFTGYHISRED